MSKSPKVQILDAAIEICMARLGQPIPSKKELKAKVAEVEERMGKTWYGSSCTDFSFYNEPEYLWLALNSWTVRSMGDLDEVISKKLHGDPITSFDFHGGIGMTTIRLAMAIPDCTCYHHAVVEDHRKICLELADKFGLKNVRAVADPSEVPSGRADLLTAQEVFEHFRDPFAELKSLLEKIKPRRYLDGSSFGIDSPGHFPTYYDGEEPVNRKNKTKSRFNGILKSRGFSPYWKRLGVKHPYNSHPCLWIHDDDEVGAEVI